METTNSQEPHFYYKIVAKLNSRYFSIFDGSTEFILNETVYQKAGPNHQGGFYVYSTLKEAIFAHIPFNPGGLFIAPRTLLKVRCWGDCQVYASGKLSFSYLCPVEDLGLPIGYKSTKTGKKAAVEGLKETLSRNKNKKRNFKRELY